jgi:hypothetical protein
MLAELSYFYRQICAKEISKKLMQRFEKEIIVLVCKMEKIFPPGFMNCMQHLLVHLPWESLVGGPVQFRWMYSQERELKKLRVMVRNKARVEGCIAEAFAAREITLFSSKYFSDANNVNAQTTWYHIAEETKMDLRLTSSPVSLIRRQLIRLAEACRMGGTLTCDAISV